MICLHDFGNSNALVKPKALFTFVSLSIFTLELDCSFYFTVTTLFFSNLWIYASRVNQLA